MIEAIDYFIQGDLDFRKVDSIPEGAKDITESLFDKQRGGYTLALGEHTNHAHTIVKDRETDVKIYEHGGKRYIKITGTPAKLLHGTFTAPGKVNEKEKDKHHSFILPTDIIIEQDFEKEDDPFLQKIKQVQD